MEFSTKFRPKGHVFNAKQVAGGIFVVTNAYEGKPTFFAPKDAAGFSLSFQSSATHPTSETATDEVVTPQKDEAV
ncbi:MAG: hypothetical protein ABSF29_01610 [Tepidisphaeraceae bacterium]|jgi:hypothetical protein